MRDYQKTKTQLIQELDILRQRLVSQSQVGLARPPRVDFDANIELKCDFELIEAQGINLSQYGLCFELKAPLTFNMRFEFEDEVHKRTAELVWVKKFPGGKYRFGLKFAD
ncbi:MAG: PilZ domain-containing protein [Candidatus Aureabacteria bacterium]|nr:PilZ domain-containing protein [Candidatus Auribacterota bacterium]